MGERARRGQVERDRSGGDDCEHPCREHRHQCLALGPRGTHAVEQIIEHPLLTGAEVLGECGDVRTAKRDGRLALLTPNPADQHQVVVQQRLAITLAIGRVHRARDELTGGDDEWGAVERLCGGHGIGHFLDGRLRQSSARDESFVSNSIGPNSKCATIDTGCPQVG